MVGGERKGGTERDRQGSNLFLGDLPDFLTILRPVLTGRKARVGAGGGKEHLSMEKARSRSGLFQLQILPSVLTFFLSGLCTGVWCKASFESTKMVSFKLQADASDDE